MRPEDVAMGDEPALYQIRVSGHLGPTLLTAFPAFVPRRQGHETVLTGLFPDSAALYGVLAEVEALGLDLLEVRKMRAQHHQEPEFS
jgi:monoterpene epsilon-lactone hydrolase